MLDEFKHEAALSVHWLFVGSSGRKERPESGGVLQSYPQCVLPENVLFASRFSCTACFTAMYLELDKRINFVRGWWGEEHRYKCAGCAAHTHMCCSRIV